MAVARALAHTPVPPPHFFHVLCCLPCSFFNLNIDVTAPECTLPNLSYKMRWVAARCKHGAATYVQETVPWPDE